MDKKEAPGGQNQRPVRKMDKQVAELTSSRLAETFMSSWNFYNIGPLFFQS